MASTKEAVASGADFDQVTRRRNVPSTTTNGGLVDRVEIDEKKTQVKQVGYCASGYAIFPSPVGRPWIRDWQNAFLEGTICPWVSRRVGVYYCASHIHNTGILHSIIQDWVVTDRNLGWSTVGTTHPFSFSNTLLTPCSFGKFGSHYLKREFYFDVHPPLGKMLVGLSGYLAGYNGSFEFKSGEKYPEELNYTVMRAFNAFFGAVCIPMAYYTAREMNFKRPAVWFVTLMVLCENSYTTISRFILLDSMLLCFTFTTVLCWARFHRLQNQSFSAEWFAWLALTGVSIGCVTSVKWVGFFVTALVGLYTAEDLWRKFGDYKMPKVS